MRQEDNKVSLCAVLLAIYFAITPVHQTLLLSNGSTVNKYLALVIMVLLFMKNQYFDNDLLNKIIPIAVFATVSIVWSGSRSESITTVISIISYMAFALIVCTNHWNDREKKLILFAFVIASVYYAVVLVGAQGTMRRSTFLGIGGKDADQNVLSINIGMAILVLTRFFYASEKVLFRICSLVLSGVILLGIFATGSRGAIVAICVGMLYIVLKSSISTKGKIRTVIVIIALVGFLIYVMEGNTKLGQIAMDRMFTSNSYQDAGSNRIIIWKKHLEILLHRPWGFLIGFGFGGESAAYRSYYAISWSQATHQDLLNVVCYGGIILLSMFIKLLKFVMRKVRLEGNILGYAWLLTALVAGLTVDFYTTYGWWNALIMAYIGIDSIFNSFHTTEDYRTRLYTNH